MVNVKKWNEIYEKMYWSDKTYGGAVKVKRNYVRALIAFLCIVTPFTNWMIPFAFKLIKNDYYFRY